MRQLLSALFLHHAQQSNNWEKLLKGITINLTPCSSWPSEKGFSFSQLFSAGIENSFKAFTLEVHKPWEKNKPDNPSSSEFPNQFSQLQALQVIWAEEKQASLFSSTSSAIPVSTSVRHLGRSEQSYTPGRICSSESCFSTTASKGWNNDSFQNSHGNSSFSLQTPLAALALHKVAEHRGNSKPAVR